MSGSVASGGEAAEVVVGGVEPSTLYVDVALSETLSAHAPSEPAAAPAPQPIATSQTLDA
jgi:hypothetical protein